MNNITTRHKKVFVLFMSLLVALLAGGTQTAHAALLACRADPIVFLSDGSRLVITLDIATAESDVQDIAYTVHGPRGTSVMQVIYTAGGLGNSETFKFYADQKPGQYSTDSVVTVGGAKKVEINAQSKLDNVDSGTASGVAQQHLVIKLQR